VDVASGLSPSLVEMSSPSFCARPFLFLPLPTAAGEPQFPDEDSPQFFLPPPGDNVLFSTATPIENCRPCAHRVTSLLLFPASLTDHLTIPLRSATFSSYLGQSPRFPPLRVLLRLDSLLLLAPARHPCPASAALPFYLRRLFAILGASTRQVSIPTPVERPCRSCLSPGRPPRWKCYGRSPMVRAVKALVPVLRTPGRPKAKGFSPITSLSGRAGRGLLLGALSLVFQGT